MKRSLVALPAFSFLFLVLTGCGSNQAAAPPKVNLVRSTASLDVAIVVDRPVELLHTGMGNVKIQSAVPDAKGHYLIGGARVAMALNLLPGDRVLAPLYLCLDTVDPSNPNKQTFSLTRIADRDPRYSPVRFQVQILKVPVPEDQLDEGLKEEIEGIDTDSDPAH